MRQWQDLALCKDRPDLTAPTRFRSVDPRVRFWSLVNTQGQDVDACWLWEGGHYAYGTFLEVPGPPGVKVMARAHRFAYQHLVADIPDGLVLDHLCRNGLCVNPLHLEPVTQGENVRRSWNHRHHPTHCPRGHAYDEENTTIYTRPNGNQTRVCRSCERERSRQRRADARRVA